MSYGPLSVFTKTIASAATLSGEFDLQRSWENVYLQIPSMVSNTAIYIQACEESGGTYRRVRHPSVNSSTVSTNEFIIASAATNCYVPIPNTFRFLKVETTATVDSGETFKIICGSN